MKEEFKTIRANLQKRRQVILSKISEEPPLQGSDDITRGDSLDIASSARDREITFMLKSRELDELRAVEDAIERIDVTTMASVPAAKIPSKSSVWKPFPGRAFAAPARKRWKIAKPLGACILISLSSCGWGPHMRD